MYIGGLYEGPREWMGVQKCIDSRLIEKLLEAPWPNACSPQVDMFSAAVQQQMWEQIRQWGLHRDFTVSLSLQVGQTATQPRPAGMCFLPGNPTDTPALLQAQACCSARRNDHDS